MWSDLYDPKKFLNQVQGEFQPTPSQRKLHELAEGYERDCDLFDDRVCSGQFWGHSIPVTPREHAAVNTNARQVFKRYLKKAEALGFDRGDLRAAIRNIREK